MPRLRIRALATPRSVGISFAAGAAACLMLGAVNAGAQMTTGAIQNPLTPAPSADPGQLSRFEKFKTAASGIQSGPPLKFVPPPEGAAGATGFDSSNARKRKGKQKPKLKPQSGAQAIAPGERAVVRSPYQVPPPSLPPLANSANAANAAGQPGSPPAALGPIRSYPKKRKAHSEIEDPYAALGVRAGAFLLYPAIEFTGGHHSNPSYGLDGKSAGLYSVAPELLLKSDWSRHELKADLRGSYAGFSPDDTPSLNRPYFNGKVDGRVDVTRNTRIDLGSRALVSTENPNSPNLQADLEKLPVFTTIGGNAGIAHRFNRFELAIKGDTERTVFQDSTLTDGSTASNDTRNYDQYGGALRGSYELSPGIKPFVEAGIDRRVHDIATDLSGFQRDSKGRTIKAGSTFELSRLLTGEFSLGHTRRDYEDTRLEQLSGLIGDASLIWTANALTTVKFTAKSTIGESTTTGVSGILYRDAGVQVDHALRRWLIGTVKFGFGLDDYIGSAREDKRYVAGLGLTYKFNRSMQLKGEVRREWMRSNESGNDYSATVLLLGLRLQY